MVLRRFFDEKLAQASYLVGCAATGEAIVIDPNRDADQYIRAARAEGLKIAAVTETHIHADYLSGTRELAARTGARIYLSEEGGPDWQYEFRNDPNVALVKHGSKIRVGNVRLDVLHTPGHTPEHLTFVLTDEPASAKALGAFTGDFVFVGDVGRPDLLERAANIKGTMEAGGRQLFASLKEFKKLDDGLLIWPGHGAGSACGKSLGGVPVSSLGYEKAANWALKTSTEQEFVNEVLSGQPEPPKYFATMKRLNKSGPKILGRLPRPQRLDKDGLAPLAKSKAQVVDVRDQELILEGLVPGSIVIPHFKSFTTWAGWLLSYDAPVTLIATDQAQADAAARDLAMIGLDDVKGWFGPEALEAYVENSGPLDSVEQYEPKRLGDQDAKVLDVRASREYAEAHVPGSLHVPLGYLSERLAEVPRDGKVAVHCASGGRSLIAVSLLKRHGFCNVCNVPGGFDAYRNVGRPMEVGEGRARPVTK